MIATDRFSIDTDVLIYAVDRRAGEKHEAALRLTALAGERDCWMTVQTLGEFFHANTRKGLATANQALEFTNVWQRVFEVCAARQSTFDQATDYVRRHGLSFWDAMFLATANENGCAAVFSEDMQHGRTVDGTHILNPFLPTAAEVTSRLLGLE